ncbi:MAG: hypothetical protein AABM67_01430 [Acidobacteriota bacterium]
MKKKHTRTSSRWSIGILALVALTAGVPRVIGALMVRKEPFGDAYCYIEQVTSMRWKMAAGTFSVADLFGFWLPLYQFVCSIFSLAVNEPVYVSKLVSAVAGTGICILVYLCANILTSNQKLSLAAALAIALNPFHIQYSMSAMTDMPHALLVIGCLYFVLIGKWTLAACLGAAACLIRLESWTLIAVFPTVEYLRRRKVPILNTLIIATGPAFWLFICWVAKGTPFASFQAQRQYMLSRLAAHPEFGQLTFDRMLIDANRLLYGVNVAVLAGCIVGLVLLVRQWQKNREWLRANDLMVCLTFFSAYLGFIALAYLSKKQSDIWPRYGLVMFALGLPVLAYSAKQILRSSSVLAKGGLAFVLVLGLLQFRTQGEDLARFVTQKTRPEIIANYLRQEYVADPSIKIFCDSPEVRIISGIPGEHYYHSFSEGVPRDREGFVGFLRQNGITLLVIPEETETSTPSQLYPGLVKETGGIFESIVPPPDDRRADSLYRLRANTSSPAG